MKNSEKISSFEKRIDLAAKWIKNSKSLVAFTGAGISTESGLPDYRGLWSSTTNKDLFQRSSPITLNHTAIPIPIHPRINPAFAKPESSFLIPITPQIIATIFGKYGINARYEKPKEIIGNIIAREIIFPIMPKIKDITPNTLPIFISPLIFVLVF
ncbi:hypothetical protein LCGC14_1878950 [marine sediment metagenome]|uniref:Uncharacterized protein n=1 Tax=marine sediment metagenome TaxID=412755 RepID=A0A0F9J1D0_9ZZZZ